MQADRDEDRQIVRPSSNEPIYFHGRNEVHGDSRQSSGTAFAEQGIWLAGAETYTCGWNAGLYDWYLGRRHPSVHLSRAPNCYGVSGPEPRV